MEVSKSTTQKQKTEKFKNISRREFMKLPLEERRRILAAQAELMLLHYQQNKEWQELQTGDLVEY
ncbi:MAG TPA: hypothetical protein VE956_09280 [Nodularia sp. (in: cyanobacteria)]|nr:hypothetical protein [Nodularia sp. (in: cyanobacteria)]